MTRPGRRRCDLCGLPFGRNARSPRVSCTLVSSERYHFSAFHGYCMARSPAKAVAIVLGVGRKTKKEASP